MAMTRVQMEVDSNPTSLAGPMGAAMPCPRCGRDLKIAAPQNVSWLPHPVRTCADCGCGVTERESADSPLRERLVTPIAIARIVIVSTMLLVIGTVAAGICIALTMPGIQMTMPNAGFPTVLIIGTLLTITTVGILAVVMLTPHQSALPSACTWMATLAIGAVLTMLFSLTLEGEANLTRLDLTVISFNLGVMAMTGLLLSYPLASMRDGLIRFWIRRGEGAPR